eukprot:1652630-Pleurochrysis_carterae.AAC.1
MWCEAEVESVADGTTDKRSERARKLLPAGGGRRMQSVRSRSHTLERFCIRTSGIGMCRTRGAGRQASFSARQTAIHRSENNQQLSPNVAAS